MTLTENASARPGETRPGQNTSTALERGRPAGVHQDLTGRAWFSILGRVWREIEDNKFRVGGGLK